MSGIDRFTGKWGWEGTSIDEKHFEFINSPARVKAFILPVTIESGALKTKTLINKNFF